MTQHSVDGPNEAADAQKGERAPPLQSYVLVVDDEAVVRQFLTRCLEGWGYTVKQAGSAAEALEMMVGKPASVVLCDIRMPGQDGLWLAERLRAHWPHTAVVMATAMDDLQTITRSRELGVVDYISKPITQEQLLQTMRRATAAEKLMSDDSDDSEESDSPELQASQETKIDAEYALESPVRCPACGERITTVKAVRMIRSQVNFTSTLPRRGRVLACPHCLAVIPAELTNF